MNDYFAARTSPSEAGEAALACRQKLRLQPIIRRWAGGFILASLLLARYQDPRWLWLAAFVGVNLLQASFTDFCPLELVLQRLGFGAERSAPARSGPADGSR